MSEKVRVLRILEYVGDREWVESTLKGSINGTKEFHSHDHREWKNVIKSVIVDQFPEILEKNK